MRQAACEAWQVEGDFSAIKLKSCNHRKLSSVGNIRFLATSTQQGMPGLGQHLTLCQLSQPSAYWV
jgi:hypothetical protein